LDPPPERAASFRRLDTIGAELGPGRVNAHTHLYSGLSPFDMPPPALAPSNFLEILERVWWRLDRALDEATLRASARWYVAESLLYGTTTLIDHHESPNFIEGSLDVLADACEELGARAVLCFGATERNGGRDEAKRGLAECARFLRENRREHVRGVMSLHASFTVSDETVRDAAALCRSLSTVMHVHLAEDGADVEDAIRRGYPGPLERLHSCGALPPGSILAHGVHLTGEQVQLVNDLDCWIVQNPRSNRGNGVGYPKALGRCRRAALGTDGYPANLVEEREVLLQEARRHGEDEGEAWRRAEPPHELVAQRFGMDFSPLRQESVADVCVFEGARARHVLVGGKLVVENGRLLTGDIEAIRAEALDFANVLWKRMAAIA
jgi:cytosine/adenosine deaminase-related metal-dependent hydrolase